MMDPRVEELIDDCGLTEDEKTFVRLFVEESGSDLADQQVALAVREAIKKVMDVRAGL